jgi:hypothetical protein
VDGMLHALPIHIASSLYIHFMYFV